MEMLTRPVVWTIRNRPPQKRRGSHVPLLSFCEGRY